jgi:pectinesterase
VRRGSLILTAVFFALYVRAATSASGLFPAAGAQAVCPDTPLRLTFAAPPSLGTSGGIRIIDAATNAVVESIDIRSPTAIKTIGGLENCKY